MRIEFPGPIAEDFFAEGAEPLIALLGPLFGAGDARAGRGFGNEPFLDRGVALVGGELVKDAELSGGEVIGGGEIDDGIGVAKVVIEPAEDGDLEILGVFVRAGADDEAEVVGVADGFVESGKFVAGADHAVEWEERILVSVDDEERARGGAGGEHWVAPSVGVYEEHAVAMAFDCAVDHIIVEVGDAGDGGGGFDAGIKRGGEP